MNETTIAPTTTPESVMLEIAELDAQFGSPENRDTGAMRLTDYRLKTEQLHSKLNIARARAAATPVKPQKPEPVKAAPAAKPALKLMDPAKLAKLDDYTKRMDVALERSDPDAIVDILQESEHEYFALLCRKHVDEASEKVSARTAYGCLLASRECTSLLFAAHALRRKALEKRLDELYQFVEQCCEAIKELQTGKKSGSIFYRKTWRDGEKYNAGEWLTYNGSLWFVNRSTDSRPGTDDSYTLAVKHGRDAK